MIHRHMSGDGLALEEAMALLDMIYFDRLELFPPLKIKAPHYRSFVRGIHRPMLDTLHKGFVIRKSFQCHNVIIIQTSL